MDDIILVSRRVSRGRAGTAGVGEKEGTEGEAGGKGERETCHTPKDHTCFWLSPWQRRETRRVFSQTQRCS